jgi:hypothetical protein
MKKITIGAMSLLAGAQMVHAQGAVNFENYNNASLANYIFVGFQPAVGSAVLIGGKGTGAPAPTLSNYAMETGNGADWTVQLYGTLGASQPVSSLTPLAGITTTLETGTSSDNTPGTWSSTLLATFTGAANGAPATIALYAWYNDGGAIANFTTALADGVPTGSDAPMTVVLGASPAPPAFLPQLGNFNVSATPEPSTIALGVIGASTFLMRLRRKQ